MAFALPKPFGKYLLVKRLAVGGMAEIYLAKSRGAEGFQRDVVIKLILPSYSEDEAFVTMFIDEARIAARLHHANIVQIFDFDKIEDSYYIAMEYVEGRDLRKVMDRALKTGKKIPPLLAVHIAAEIAAGLKYAHTRKGEDGRPLDIVHRDVSPHNILVSYGGEVKITDFGIAKAAARSTKTRAGTVKGKCAYMSPEQARGKVLDGRSDLFAVSSILWEMLTGRRAFDGDTDFEILNNVLNQNVPPPSLFAPVPRELDAIVLKGLRKEREERHADMAAFEKDLRAYCFKHASDLDEMSLGPYMQDLFADDIRSGTEEEIAAATTPSGARAAGSSPPRPSPAAPESPGDGTLLISDEMRPTPGPAASTDGGTQSASADGKPPRTVPVGMLKQELEQILDGREGARSQSTQDRLRAGAASTADRMRAGVSSTADRMRTGAGSTADRLRTGAVSTADRLRTGTASTADRLRTGAVSTADRLRAGAASSSDRLAAAGGDEADQPTMAIPASEAERLRASLAESTVAIAGDPAVSTGRLKVGTGSRAAVPAQRSRVGLWVVFGVLLAGAAGAGAYVMHAMSEGPAPAAGGVAGGTVAAPAPDVSVAPDPGAAVASTADEGRATPEARVEPARCTIDFDVSPANATLKVNGEAVPGRDGKRVIEGRFKVGDEIEVVAAAPGHRDYSSKVVLGQPRETIRVKLDPAPQRPQVVETGFVTINARPWADVYFRGRKVGTTPLRGLEVPVGRQTFTLKNATTSRQVVVTVEKGRNTTPPVVDML